MTTVVRETPKTHNKRPPRRWRQFDPILLFLTLALSAAGILAVYFAGAEDGQYYAANQTVGFVVGLCGAIPLALIDYRVWRRFLRPIYVLVLLMLLAVQFFGSDAGGATRWIDIGPVQIQPSEFAKLGMVIVLAGYFAENSVGEHGVFLKALGILALPALLVFWQPDLGTALVFGAVFAVMSFVAGARLIQLVALVASAVAAAFAAIKFRILEPYQVAQAHGLLEPGRDLRRRLPGRPIQDGDWVWRHHGQGPRRHRR